MKRQNLFQYGVGVCALCMAALCAGTLPADAATIPQVGGRLVVCGQNAYNYFVIDLTNTRPSYHTVSELEERTDHIAQALWDMQADIYAFNELENAGDSVLSYLTAALNRKAGTALYAAVSDDCTKGNDSEQIKSGFIYRTDKVQPLGTNRAVTNRSYYRNTMRWQAFTERSTGEAFVLSMNHFRARIDDSEDDDSMRLTNAKDLVSGLAGVAVDPDILILGDMNAYIDEEPLVYIVNQGYEEQLLRHDANAYSYVYRGAQELIDHAFANSSMAEQVTGAGVYHVNTEGSWYTDKYSDHDPYLVGLNLASKDKPQPTECEDIAFTQDFTKDLNGWSNIRVKGGADWYSNSSYGACINGYQKNAPQEVWLISPAFDLSGKEKATITFRHNVFKNNSNQYAKEQTLWVSNHYTNGETPDETDWTQITIPTYGVKKWVDCTVSVPTDNLQDGFHYAFKYTAESSTAANYWEIDNTTLTAACAASAIKTVETVSLYEAETRVYSVYGVEMTAQRNNLPRGIYLLVNGNRATKIMVR